MSRQDLLDTKYRRRLILGSAFVTTVALISLRFFIIPTFTGEKIPSLSGITNSIIDNLLTALVASITITLLSVWLTPPKQEIAVIEAIEPKRIREVMDEAYYSTSEWWYRGAVGRHFRSVTLPILARQARVERITKRIYLLIIDPRKADTYIEVVRLARPSLSYKYQGLTVEQLREELLATIIAIYSTKAEEPLLEIQVGLMDAVGVYRIDLSSEIALLTTEGSQDFGLKTYRGTSFYQYFREDLNMSLKQAKRLPDFIKATPLDDLTPDIVKSMLEQLNLYDKNLTDDSIDKIIKLSMKRKNPYEGS